MYFGKTSLVFVSPSDKRWCKVFHAASVQTRTLLQGNARQCSSSSTVARENILPLSVSCKVALFLSSFLFNYPILLSLMYEWDLSQEICFCSVEIWRKETGLQEFIPMNFMNFLLQGSQQQHSHCIYLQFSNNLKLSLLSTAHIYV